MQSFFFSPPTRTIFSSSRAYCNSYLPKLPNLSFQISNFSKMNRGRGRNHGGYDDFSKMNRGRGRNRGGSNRESPHHQKQDNPIVDELDGPSPHNKVISTSAATTSSGSTVGHNRYAPNIGSPSQPCETLCATQDPSMVGPAEVGWNMGHSRPEWFDSTLPQLEKASPKMEYDSSVSTVGPSDTESDGVMGRNRSTWSKSEVPHPMRTSPKREYSPECSKKVTPHPECSKKEILHPRKISPKREHSHNNSGTVFDICVEKCGAPMLKPSLLDQNREKRKEFERLVNDPRHIYLRPGMVLLKNYISRADQIQIVKKCRAFGIGLGGFYQPGYGDEAKLCLHMMCLGKDWDPQRRSYDDIRSIDGAKPPTIPDVFKKVVSEAIHASHGIMRDEGERNPDAAIPQMEPDICIVNFYKESGKLGLHQDRDESPESIRMGLPVVSFSIGDSAEFLYGDDRDADNAKKVELKSGDVLIFGGKSRHIFHGVAAIIPNSAPKFLSQEANLRPGRLNLTFRKH